MVDYLGARAAGGCPYGLGANCPLVEIAERALARTPHVVLRKPHLSGDRCDWVERSGGDCVRALAPVEERISR
jgi:hypothetical protein